MVLVDTSAWIELHRRDGDPAVKLAVRGLLDAFEAALCGSVEMEYLGGAKPAQRERLQAWCNVLPYLRNDQKIWRKAAANSKPLHDPLHGGGGGECLVLHLFLDVRQELLHPLVSKEPMVKLLLDHGAHPFDRLVFASCC